MDETQITAVRAVQGGVPVEDVAEELGVASSTVYAWCRDNDIVARARESKYDAVVDDYVNSDKTVAQILADHDIAQNTLYRILAKRNIPTRAAARQTEATDERILAMYDAGVKMDTIRRKTGRGFPHIYDLIDSTGRERRGRGNS